jgi:hypothetical protein
MRRRAALLLGTSLALGAQAAEPKLPAELLEFLGSIDSDDPEWHDYLASTDVKKLPKPPATDKDKDRTKAPK